MKRRSLAGDQLSGTDAEAALALAEVLFEHRNLRLGFGQDKGARKDCRARPLQEVHDFNRLLNLLTRRDDDDHGVAQVRVVERGKLGAAQSRLRHLQDGLEAIPMAGEGFGQGQHLNAARAMRLRRLKMPVAKNEARRALLQQRQSGGCGNGAVFVSIALKGQEFQISKAPGLVAAVRQGQATEGLPSGLLGLGKPGRHRRVVPNRSIKQYGSHNRCGRGIKGGGGHGSVNANSFSRQNLPSPSRSAA